MSISSKSKSQLRESKLQHSRGWKVETTPSETPKNQSLGEIYIYKSGSKLYWIR